MTRCWRCSTSRPRASTRRAGRRCSPWSAGPAWEFGISIVLSTHLMGDVERTCDRVVVLDGGHVVEEGEVSQFTRETQTIYVDVDDHRDALRAALAPRGG